MTRYDLDCSDRDDLWECPECKSVFAWHDYTAQTGSGNNDEETLTRLGVAEAGTIRTLAHDATSLTNHELAALGAGIAAVPPGIRELVIKLVRRDMTIAQRFVPHLLDHADRHPWAIELLQRLASTPDEAAHVRAAIDQREDAHLEPLRQHLRVVGCSICREIPYYPPLDVSRIPKLAVLKRLGDDAHHGVRECPECGSLFEWDGAGVMRIADALANALRECFHATTVSPAALQMVKNCGAHWSWVFEHVEQRTKI
jgi:hypothetical protein